MFLAGPLAAGPLHWQGQGQVPWQGQLVWALMAATALGGGTFLWRSAGWGRPIVITLVVISIGAMALGVVGDRGRPLASRPLPESRIRTTSSVLLVTADVARREASVFPAERWVMPDDVIAASPVRDPALASVLTGRPVHYHRCGFDGDPLRDGTLTIGRMLAGRGFVARQFDQGTLPDWCVAGLERERGGLAEAVTWVAARERAPRFAHVHLDGLDASAVDRAVQTLSVDRVEVFVVSLVGSPALDDNARFLREDDLHVLVAWRESESGRPALQNRPRSACAVVPTLLARLDVRVDDPTPMSLGSPSMEEVVPDDAILVVSIAHRRDGRPHRILARSALGTLSIEATPLGRHDPDDGGFADWEFVGPTMFHPAYRNAYQGDLPDGERDELLNRLQIWHVRSGWTDVR